MRGSEHRSRAFPERPGLYGPAPCLISRIAALPPGPFARLAALSGRGQARQGPDQPGGGRSRRRRCRISSRKPWRDRAASFGNYPAIAGTEDWRQAAAGWLNRRFALNGAIDAEKHVLPLAGTREGLFSVLFPLDAARPRPGAAPDRGHAQSLLSVLCGGGAGRRRRAALCAGTEREWLPARFCRPARRRRWSGWRRSISARPPIPKARWRARLIGKACSRWPSGMISSCWPTNAMPTSGSTRPPHCALPARLAQSGGFTRLLTFHSLSKRSGLPGLRSGMVAGDEKLIAEFRAFRNVAGPTVPDAAAGGIGRRLARRRPCRQPAAPPIRKRWRRPSGSWAIA